MALLCCLFSHQTKANFNESAQPMSKGGESHSTRLSFLASPLGLCSPASSANLAATNFLCADRIGPKGSSGSFLFMILRKATRNALQPCSNLVTAEVETPSSSSSSSWSEWERAKSFGNWERGASHQPGRRREPHREAPGVGSREVGERAGEERLRWRFAGSCATQPHREAGSAWGRGDGRQPATYARRPSGSRDGVPGSARLRLACRVSPPPRGR